MRDHLSPQQPYGAAELKAYEPRALLLSYLVSAVIVQAVALLLAWWSAPPMDAQTQPGPGPTFIPYHVLANPPIARLPVPERAHRAGVIPKLAIPVPVADPPADSSIMFPTTEQLHPAGTVEGDSLGTGIVIVEGGSIAVDPELAPFEPRQVEPAVIVRVEPAYPPIAIRAALEGNVFVQVWVDTKGAVRKAVVVKSDGEVFNEAATEAARRWVFTPALMQDRPVSVWVTIPFRFRLAQR